MLHHQDAISLHQGHSSVQDMATQTPVMSMLIIKVAADSQSLFMLFTAAAAWAHRHDAQPCE